MNNSKAKISTLSNIQSIINRLADTSSKLKATYITIISAILTVFMTYIIPKKESIENTFNPEDKLYGIIIFLVIFLAFLLIDSYYLRYERVMRKVYDSKARDIPDNINSNINYFDISATYKKILEEGGVSYMPSKSQFLFYFIPFLVISITIAMMVLR
jgi:D-alanyl-lipoteichoic acid acyltransferase DltB (MBOAT superfamily)